MCLWNYQFAKVVNTSLSSESQSFWTLVSETYVSKNSSFVAFSADNADTPVRCASRANDYLEDFSIKFFCFSLGLFYVQKCPHIFLNCCPLWNWCIRKFSPTFMTAVLVGTLFSYVIVWQYATFTDRHAHRAGTQGHDSCSPTSRAQADLQVSP